MNYWPIRKAMEMWKDFDAGEIRDDFARLGHYGLSPARIFLLWEDFQPSPRRISIRSFNNLAEVARQADDHGVKIWVTLFTGHMSGANWLPSWMILPGPGEKGPFPLITECTPHQSAYRNPYSEEDVREVQKYLIHELTIALHDHPALWGWDLGNEPSNFYRPADTGQGRTWLEEMIGKIREIDKIHPVTLGLHQKDLEENRCIGPAEVAESCDLLTMHAYPAYSAWSAGKTDPVFPLFLAELTSRLGGRPEVWISEFGISTAQDPLSTDEESAARYASEALEYMRRGCVPGALWWCYGDYAPQVWERAPFNELVHERSFGLFRNDGSPKQIASVIEKAPRTREDRAVPSGWFDLEPFRFWSDPEKEIQRLYRNFREGLQKREEASL